MARRRVVVVGTGTSIGKTHVTASLLGEWLRCGRDAVALKPIESTARGELSDQQLLNGVLAFHVKQSPQAGLEQTLGQVLHVKHALYTFDEPLSPHLAARRAGVTIRLPRVIDWVGEHGRETTLIETAGGLFSPLGADLDNLTLAAALAPAFVLLVVPDRLGALHDAAATIGLATRRGLRIDAVVLSAPQTPDSSTTTNADEMRYLAIATPVATFPRAPLDDSRTRAAAAQVAAAIDAHLAAPLL